MKSFCILLFVGVSYTLASLTAPKASLAEKNSEWKLIWEPVVMSDQKEPLLGYKVKVNIYHYNIIDYVTTEEQKELFFTQEIQVTNGTEIKINMEENIPYEFLVQAFTENEDGPFSEPQRITIEHGEEEEP